MRKRVLIFSPYQGIPEHSFIEKKLSEILEEDIDYQIDVMTCNGFLKQFCVTMAANRLTFLSPPAEKEKICVKCKQYKKELYGKRFSGKVLSIDERITPEIEAVIAQETPQIEKQIQDYVFHDLPMGLISSYLLILSHKLADLDNLTDSIRAEYISKITNNMKVLMVMEKVLAETQYSAVIFYNGNYEINNTVVSLIKKSFPEIRPILIHYGHNWARSRDKLFLIKKKHNEHLRERIHFYEKNPAAIDLSKYDMTEVDDYVKALQSARTVFIYSAAKSNEANQVFQTLGLDPSKPTALMSLSSNDEKFATQYAVTQTDRYDWIELTFQDQMDWIEKTVEYFAKNPQWQLIIRIHPREYPNKREKTLSKAAAFYQKISERLPANAVINSPDHKISIYDLFDAVHLHLTSWSTVGLESALTGLPTISTTRGFGLYPNKYVHFFSAKAEEYFGEIKRVLSLPKKVDTEMIQRAKNWVLYDFNHTILNFDTNNFWEKKPAFLRRLVNKFIVPIRLLSYRKFSREFKISQAERKVIREFFENNKDIFETKTEMQS